MLGLSITSAENNFIKPTLIPIDDSVSKNSTKIIAGRNPIVEQLLNEKKFIANDIYFDDNQN